MAQVKVLVGSNNPVKIEAVREAFSRFFTELEVKGIPTASGVPDQPYGDQAFEGARNRARNLMREKADFYVGLEGGVTRMAGRDVTMGAFCIVDASGRESFGTSPMLQLPPKVVAGLKQGKELGTVMDELTGEHNTKQNLGAVGIFTRGVIDRKSFYVQGLCVALAPFLNPELYE